MLRTTTLGFYLCLHPGNGAGLGLVVVVCLCVLSRSVKSDSFATPQTVARKAPLSMEFPRQGYQGGLPCPVAGPYLPGQCSRIWGLPTKDTWVAV